MNYKTNYRTEKNNGHLSYLGEFEGNRKEGFGVSIHYKGGPSAFKESYYGGHIADQMTGNGEMKYGEKHICKGSFSDGQAHGYAEIAIDNKHSGEYCGFMHTGSYHGLGIFKYMYNDFYYGYTQNNMHNGFGILVGDSNSFLYVGNFTGGHFNGSGYYIKILQDYIFEYTGEFITGQMAGVGCMKRTFHTVDPPVVIHEYAHYEWNEASGYAAGVMGPQKLLFESPEGTVKTFENFAQIRAGEDLKFYRIKARAGYDPRAEYDDTHISYKLDDVHEHEMHIVHKEIGELKKDLLGIGKLIDSQCTMKFKGDMGDVSILEGPIASKNNLLYRAQLSEGGRRSNSFVKCTLTLFLQDVYLATYERLQLERITMSLMLANNNLKNDGRPPIPMFIPEFVAKRNDIRHRIYNHDNALGPKTQTNVSSGTMKNETFRHESVPLDSPNDFARLLNGRMNRYSTFYEYLDSTYFLHNLMYNENLGTATLCVIFDKALQAFQHLEKLGMYHNHIDENHIWVGGLDQEIADKIEVKLVGFSNLCYFEEEKDLNSKTNLKDRIRDLSRGRLAENLKNYKESMGQQHMIHPIPYNDRFLEQLNSSPRSRMEYLTKTKRPIDLWNYSEDSMYLRPEERWVLKTKPHTIQIQTWTSVSQRDIFALGMIFMRAFCLQGQKIINKNKDSEKDSFNLLAHFDEIFKKDIHLEIRRTGSTAPSVRKVFLDKIGVFRETLTRVFLSHVDEQHDYSALYFNYMGYFCRIVNMLTQKYVAFNEILPADMEILLGRLQVGDVEEEKKESTLEEKYKEDLKVDKPGRPGIQIQKIRSEVYYEEVCAIADDGENMFWGEVYCKIKPDPDQDDEKHSLCYGTKEVREFTIGENFHTIYKYCIKPVKKMLKTLPFEIKFVAPEERITAYDKHKERAIQLLMGGFMESGRNSEAVSPKYEEEDMQPTNNRDINQNSLNDDDDEDSEGGFYGGENVKKEDERERMRGGMIENISQEEKKEDSPRGKKKAPIMHAPSIPNVDDIELAKNKGKDQVHSHPKVHDSIELIEDPEEERAGITAPPESRPGGVIIHDGLTKPGMEQPSIKLSQIDEKKDEKWKANDYEEEEEEGDRL